MKKIVFLVLIQTLFYLSGCSSIHSLLHTSAETNSHIAGTTKEMNAIDDDGDFYLPISTRTSVNIDVECILDYVQGTADVDNITSLPVHAAPWIRYQIRF